MFIGFQGSKMAEFSTTLPRAILYPPPPESPLLTSGIPQTLLPTPTVSRPQACLERRRPPRAASVSGRPPPSQLPAVSSELIVPALADLDSRSPAAGESSFCAAAARRGINVAAMIDAVAALITSLGMLKHHYPLPSPPQIEINVCQN